MLMEGWVCDARQHHPSPSYTALKGLNTMVPPLPVYHNHHHSALHYGFMAPSFVLPWAGVGAWPTHGSPTSFAFKVSGLSISQGRDKDCGGGDGKVDSSDADNDMLDPFPTFTVMMDFAPCLRWTQSQMLPD